MRLIHLPELNCYHNCIITLANYFGLPYIQAFSGLWAESKLRYDPICRVFLTQRMPRALETMGIKLATPCVSQKERESVWTSLSFGAFALVGMDAFLIPWTPLYQLQHGPHYFIVQKGLSDLQICFDPTYDLSGQKLSFSQLCADAYSLIAVQISEFCSFFPDENISLAAQALEVLKKHPKTLEVFLSQSETWLQAEETALFPAKFVDALLTGRRLYYYFLMESCGTLDHAPLFQSHAYYREWRTVKNGFYKAALTRGNHTVFHEVCRRFTSLLKQEIVFAEQILNLK